jgi:hypothetical protein
LRDISISSIPRAWVKRLLRRRWFRELLSRGPPCTKESGVDRSVPMSVSVPPVPEAYETVTWISAEIQRLAVAYWKGRKVTPFERRLVRLPRKSPRRPVLPPCWYRLKTPEWAFVWPSEVLAEFEDFYPHLLLSSRSDLVALSIDDHPFLSVRRELHSEPRRRYAPAPGIPPPSVFLVGACATGGVWFGPC